MIPQETWLIPDLLKAPLSELRNYEWQWLDPHEPLPAQLKLDKLKDKVSFGAFSRSRLQKAFERGLSGNAWHRFAWECAAIAINPTFAEAYVRRAIDGNLIFSTQGRVQRLQGWNIRGNTAFYDTDYAIVDTTISLQLFSDWDWALSIQGMLLWQKARRSMGDPVWVNLAKIQLERCLHLSKNDQIIQDCKKWLVEIREPMSRYK